jgi:hypothetical protein
MRILEEYWVKVEKDEKGEWDVGFGVGCCFIERNKFYITKSN